jgi:transposase
MSPVGGRSGPSIEIGSIPLGWCSSMRPGPNQYGAAAGLGAARSTHQSQSTAGRWQTMTFMAALRHDRITAPWFIEGPINGEAFLLYIEKVLAPTLRHGDIVIMDNLGSHKAHAVRRAIRAAGARLFYLPKYSPDLNPIEQFFAKFKHWLRKAAQRTTEAVYDAIAPILETVSPAECANYFANAGCDQT